MRKSFYFLTLFIITAMLSVSTINATSGQLSKDSIKTCNGTTYGMHSGHWHIAVKRKNGYYPSGAALSKDPCGSTTASNTTSTTSKNITTTAKIVQKDSDTSLKAVFIDEKEVNSEMTYNTKQDSITIKATPTSNKATISIDSPINLNIGKNYVDIRVTAEDGSQKTHVITINRIAKSSNKYIEIYFENEKLNFTDNKTSITIENDKTSADITYKLADSNTTAKILNNENLQVGKNIINIIVTAEDNSTDKYIIEVDRLNDESISAVAILFIIPLYGIISYVIFILLKKFYVDKKTS